ncbi:MAG: radical SAM protein [Dehalococcoidia bacterium]|nr:radical SAM protein [Dehalococcoidia bacterium]
MNSPIPQDAFAPLDDLRDCTCCPRSCHARRNTDRLGFCQSGMGFNIGSIVAHRGEEPVISGPKGVCNIFFTHCNMQCIFCQNYQISRNDCHNPAHQLELTEVIDRIEAVLNTGVRSVGFVSASHFIPQMRVIMNVLEAQGRRPTYVFNTNSYDRRETIAFLEGQINVYLPDLKYMDEDLARRYSQTPDYPVTAAAALREMFRQKGSNIMLDEDGNAESGMIIRHLILPGQIENSKKCLRFIAEELSPSIHVSLMAQYYPTPEVATHPELGRCLTQAEYEEVLEEFYSLGFYRGWVQELESEKCYRPDFDQAQAFE